MGSDVTPSQQATNQFCQAASPASPAILIPAQHRPPISGWAVSSETRSDQHRLTVSRGREQEGTHYTIPQL